MVPFVLAGMCAGAIAALPAHAPAFFAFIWPALVPYAVRLAIEDDALSRTMALVALLYAVGLSVVGWQVHCTLRRAAELNLQNATLVDRLDADRIFYGYGDYAIRFLHQLVRRGGRVLEIPTVYGLRKGGESKTRVLAYLWTYLASVVRLRLTGR